MDIYLQGMRERRGSGWGLVLSVIWPIFLMFSVKICKNLMFSVLEKLTVKLVFKGVRTVISLIKDQ